MKAKSDAADDVKAKRVIPRRVAQRLLGLTDFQINALFLSGALEFDISDSGRMATNIRSIERCAEAAGK